MHTGTCRSASTGLYDVLGFVVHFPSLLVDTHPQHTLPLCATEHAPAILQALAKISRREDPPQRAGGEGGSVSKPMQ